MFIMFTFFSLYTLELQNFFVYDFAISYHKGFQTEYYLNKVAILNGLFLVFFGSLVYNINENNLVSIESIRQPEKIYFYVCSLLFLLSAHYGISGETILTSGYASDDRAKSPLFEYSMVFFILLLFFSSGTRIQNIFSWILLSLFCLKSMLYGGRIEVLQIILIMFYFQTNFFRTWKLKKIYFVMLFGYILLLIVGRIRTNPVVIFELVNNPFALFQFSPLSSNGIVSSQFGDIQQSSVRMVGFVDTGFWDATFRVKSFLSYLFNIFLFGTDFKENANLGAQDKQMYTSGGGGLIAAQFYVWLGWFGPIFSASFLGIIMRRGLKTNVSSGMFIYVFTLLATFPRWYAYGPLMLVKFGVVTLCFFLIFKFVKMRLLEKQNSIINTKV